MDATIAPMWQNLFQSESIYFLPKYQRLYSWEKTQLDDFWHDIRDAYAQNSELPYLLGTLYFAKMDFAKIKQEVNAEVWSHYENVGTDTQHYLIIDGQQRITTFFLLQLVLSGKKNLLYEQRPKLALGRVDFEFLKSLLENRSVSPLTKSHKNIKFTYDYLKEKIANLDEQEKFRSYIQQNLQAVFITLVSHHEIATMLFVSQTDRGKRLTVLDKLKSSLMFYTQKIEMDRSSEIDNLYGELYEVTEYCVSLNLYKNSSKMESEIVRILHVLLKKKSFYDTKILGDMKSHIGWEAGADRIYDVISVMLRNTKTKEKKECIESIYTTLVDINSFLKYVYRIRVHERENQFLDPYANVVWYPYFQLFRLLNPTRFSKALLVELFSKLQSKDHSSNLLHFIDIEDTNTHSDSIFAVTKRNLVDVLQKERIKAKYLKLQTLLSDTTSEYYDIAQIQQYDALFAILQKKLNRSLQRINSFQDYLDNRYISIINLVEKIEMSIWKSGKRPIGSFIKNENDVDSLLKHTMNFMYKYKDDHNYLLRDFGFSNIKYLLLEYERIVYRNSNNYQKILDLEVEIDDNVTIQREHIYPVTPDDKIASKLKEIWYDNKKERYENWIWKIGNITLLEHNINIGNASNKTIWEKASIYKKKESLFLQTQELADDILELKDIFDALGIEENSSVSHYAYKLLLEIRELELLSFLYCRF